MGSALEDTHLESPGQRHCEYLQTACILFIHALYLVLTELYSNAIFKIIPSVELVTLYAFIF